MGVGNEVDERVRRNEGAADWIGFDELVARLYGMCVCADGWMDGWIPWRFFFLFLSCSTDSMLRRGFGLSYLLYPSETLRPGVHSLASRT